MGSTFVGLLRHFSSRQTICRPLLMARWIIEEPQACGETFSFRFKDIDGPISLLEQVFVVKVTFTVLSSLKENPSLSGFGNVR